MPQTEGNYFYLEGDINVTANAGLEIRILGMNFSGDLNCSSGTASETNRCDLFFIDCNVYDPGTQILDGDCLGLSFHVLYCDMPDTKIKFRFGEIIASKIDAFHIAPGDGINYNDTIKIIANIVTCTNYESYNDVGGFGSSSYDAHSCYNSKSHYYFIANNYFKHTTASGVPLLIFFNSDTLGTGENMFVNNTINNTSHAPGGSIAFLVYHVGSSSYWSRPNTNILNNLFRCDFISSTSSVYRHYSAIGTGSASYLGRDLIGNIKYNVFGDKVNNDSTFAPWGYSSSYVLHVCNFIMDPYNYWLENSEFSGISHFNFSNGVITSGMGIDKGYNSPLYYDIDMTRNDCGTGGGPYSMENYWNSTATGKARIYHLDMPSEIWSGQTPTIKASAVHKK